MFYERLLNVGTKALDCNIHLCLKPLQYVLAKPPVKVPISINKIKFFPQLVNI